jgi:hypothetical protein
MKKLLTVLFTLAIALSLGMPAFAKKGEKKETTTTLEHGKAHKKHAKKKGATQGQKEGQQEQQPAPKQ